MTITCEYCAHEGELRPLVSDGDLEIRTVGDRTVITCVDTTACDARWERANPEEDR